MRHGRAVVIVGLAGLAMLGGCAEEGTSLTLAEYGTAAAEAVCDTTQACYGDALLEAFGGPACTTFESCPGTETLAAYAGPDCADRVAAQFRQAIAPQLEAAIASGTVVFDGDRARECVEELRAAGCGLVDRVAIEACEQTLVGSVPLGGACALTEECAGDSYCRTDAACPGTCEARVGSGAACSSDEACEAGLRCFGGTCQAPAGATAACGGPSMIGCAGGLVCLDERCRPLGEVQVATLGMACDLAEALCEPGLSCAMVGVSDVGGGTFECVGPASAGGSCHLGFPDPCPSGHVCRVSSSVPGNVEGSCTPLPGDGEACLDGTEECATGTRCVSGTCRAARGLGGACSADADCISAHCDDGVCAESVLCTDR